MSNENPSAEKFETPIERMERAQTEHEWAKKIGEMFAEPAKLEALIDYFENSPKTNISVGIGNLMQELHRIYQNVSPSEQDAEVAFYQERIDDLYKRVNEELSQES